MISEGYTERYKKNTRTAVYPVEFVVRAFLGTYPGLLMPKDRYEGARVLDLGFGDGRNIPLLHDLGMQVHGVEISDEICAHAQARLKKLGVAAELKVGTNRHIPYEDNYFSYLLACHSCYYIEKGDTFSGNLDEIARVMKQDGVWVASLPMMDSYILKGAKPQGDGHFEISQDPYGLRNGVIFRAFGSEQDVRNSLAPYFHEIQIGYCDDMYWGIHQKVWIVVGRKLKK